MPARALPVRVAPARSPRRDPAGGPDLTPPDRALVELGRALRDLGYAFTTVTPETHRRVNARPSAIEARTIRDVFGWSRPFALGTLPAGLEGLLRDADALVPTGDLWKSRVRYATLGSDLFVHSAFPTDDADAVFLGPDTYRFVALLRRVLPGGLRRLVDVGCGSGAGGLAVRDRAEHLTLADLNEAALRHAAVNVTLAGSDAEIVHSDVLSGVDGEIDAVVANPPYLVDDGKRLYRDGGDRGTAIAVRIVEEALQRLVPGGTLVLYTGTPVVDGEAVLVRQLAPLLNGLHATWEELDPDVFGDELDRPAYADVERIALLGLVVRVHQ